MKFSIEGLINGKDRVLVGPEKNGKLERNQLRLAYSYCSPDITCLVMTNNIPIDTPKYGIIRVECESGDYKRIKYSSYFHSLFIIENTNFLIDHLIAGNNCFVGYIDDIARGYSMSFDCLDLKRSFLVRVRNAGKFPIKLFETTGTLESFNGSVVVDRIPDNFKKEFF